jgi:hypothetical protein
MTTQPHVFSVDGVQFAAGLFWQPLSEASNGEKQKEIKSLAKELKFSLFVLRNTSIECVGFANPSDEIKFGVSSAAAVVSKTLEVEMEAKDFIFVTQLETGRWIYIAQRDGLILPDGDKVFNSEDEARSRLLEDKSVVNWSLIIAPQIWGISKSIERDFGSMIPRTSKGKIKVHKWWRLKNIDSNKELARHKWTIIIGLAAVTALGLGIKEYKAYKYAKEMQEADAAAKAMMAAQNQQIVVVHPWKNMPVASEFLNSCTKALEGVRLFPGNWSLTSATCNNGNLTISWKPNGTNGWIDHLRAIHPNAMISMDGSLASVTKPLSEMQVGSDEDIQIENERLVQMYSAAQRYGFKFTVAPPAPVVAALPGQENVGVQPKDWNEITWKAEGIQLPATVLTGLSGNGFRLTAMSANWQNGQFIWTMEGIQYVK